MKRNLITLITAAVLVVIFALLLFTFQVRQSEVAVVTTFGKTTGTYEPGLHLRWPWPIQQVYKFDERIQNFEDKFSESLTADQHQPASPASMSAGGFPTRRIFSTASRTAPWPPPKASSKAC